MLCVAAWVWFCLSTEFVGGDEKGRLATRKQSPELAFTRCSFVDSRIVHQSILFLPFNAYYNPRPLDFAMNIAQYMVSLQPPCFVIQHTILVMAISCKGHVPRRIPEGGEIPLHRDTTRYPIPIVMLV